MRSGSTSDIMRPRDSNEGWSPGRDRHDAPPRHPCPAGRARDSRRADGAGGGPAGRPRPAERPAAQDAVGRRGEARDGRDQPASGDGRRDPRPPEGGQRDRRGDRRQRGARRRRADVVRDRRRPVRHRLGRQDQEALRPQRQRARPVRRDDRRVPAEGARPDPHARPFELVGAGVRRRLGPAPVSVRHDAAGRPAWRRRSPTPRRASRSARSSPTTGRAPRASWSASRPRPPASCPAVRAPRSARSSATRAWPGRSA